MTSGCRPVSAARFDRASLFFIAASMIWAAVIIDTGDVVWPLAVWTSTALVPLSVYRRTLGQRTSSC